MDFLWAVSVILSGTVAGAALNNAIAMVPALRSLDERTSYEVRRGWSGLPEAYVAVATSSTAIAGLALLLFADHLSSGTQALLSAGIALSLTTASAAVPAIRLETVVRADPGEGPSPRYHGIQRRWDAAQVVMAVCSLGILVCFAIAAGRGS